MSFWPNVTELLPELRAYGRSISDSRADADDLVSDAIERAARSRARPRGVDALRPWMFRVIRNLSIDGLRKKRVRREYRAAQERLLEERPIDAGCEEAVALRLALEKLGSREREVIVLIDIAGLSYAEAASVMGVPIGTVMSRISRARRALLALMEPEAAERPGRRRGGACG